MPYNLLKGPPVRKPRKKGEPEPAPEPIVKGVDYIKGDQGERGFVGPAGPQGPKGDKGEPGKDGRDGRDGIHGENGLPGRPGRDGAPGLRGPKGDPGDIGPMGPTGADGAIGPPGPPGLSAIAGHVGAGSIVLEGPPDKFVRRFKFTGSGAPTVTYVSRDRRATLDFASGGAHPDLATHDALGLATDAELSAHEAAADPHTGYVREADANWVDLTDTGETTLHTHPAGAGISFTTIAKWGTD